jgi:hypothetical protein
MNDMTTFDRVFAMPDAHTFKMKPVKEILDWYCKHPAIVIDPFARDSKYAGEYSNDLSSSFNQPYSMDAIEFLDMAVEAELQVNVVLLDPPYSPRQISEVYQSVGRQVTGKDTQTARLYKECKDRLDKLLLRNGIAICFGWNSGGFGINRGYDLLHVRMIYHGAAHNDTIVTIERKRR